MDNIRYLLEDLNYFEEKYKINKYSEGFMANQAEKILTAGKNKVEAEKAISEARKLCNLLSEANGERQVDYLRKLIRLIIYAMDYFWWGMNLYTFGLGVIVTFPFTKIDSIVSKKLLLKDLDVMIIKLNRLQHKYDGETEEKAKKAIEKLTIARDKLKRNINKNN